MLCRTPIERDCEICAHILLHADGDALVLLGLIICKSSKLPQRNFRVLIVGDSIACSGNRISLRNSRLPNKLCSVLTGSESEKQADSIGTPASDCFCQQLSTIDGLWCPVSRLLPLLVWIRTDCDVEAGEASEVSKMKRFQRRSCILSHWGRALVATCRVSVARYQFSTHAWTRKSLGVFWRNALQPLRIDCYKADVLPCCEVFIFFTAGLIFHRSDATSRLGCRIWSERAKGASTLSHPSSQRQPNGHSGPPTAYYATHCRSV